jgi:microcystin-dependent protein
MADPFVGEIKMWMMSWAPRGWAFCNGAILPIQQNAALYSLLGTQFGGDGKTTFGLPDLRGRVAIGTTTSVVSGLSTYKTGAAGGTETVTVTPNQVPSHTHAVVGDSNPGNAIPPTGAYLATAVSNTSANFLPYAASGATLDATLYTGTAASSGTVSSAGGNQPHANMQPFTVINFTIATAGLYPQRP